MESPDPKEKGGTMADKAPVAYRVVAKNMDGDVVSDSYVAPDNYQLVAKVLRQEMFTVTVEPVDKLPDGVKL
jgi:hypothetical protein